MDDPFFNELFNTDYFHSFIDNRILKHDAVYEKLEISNHEEFESKLYCINKDDSCIQNMRYIDWKRGEPYVFKMDDYESLVDSPFLFARKFSLDVDCQIVQEIYQYVNQKNKEI